MKTSREQLRLISTLTERSDFLAVQSSGQKWVSKGLILQVRENDLSRVRVGYTVSKKVYSSAVKRNRIRRRLKSVAAEILTTQAKTGYDYVLVGRKETFDKPYEALVGDLTWCLKKMGFHNAA